MEIASKFKKSQDRVASLGMILQVPFTALILLVALAGTPFSPFLLLVLLLLPAMHLPETWKLLWRKKDLAVLALPAIFSLRNLIWLWAGAAWIVKDFLKTMNRVYQRESRL
jgi:hypothetical protein